MFVLGVDPGLTRCGYGVLQSTGPTRQRVIAGGIISTPAADPTASRLAEVQRQIRAIIAEYSPAVVAIERVLFQVNVRTAMGVGQASGIVMAEAAAAGCDVVEYSPNEIKSAVAGDGAASKDQMELMVQTLLKIDKPLRPVDVADALAIALCHLAHAPRIAALARGAR